MSRAAGEAVPSLRTMNGITASTYIFGAVCPKEGKGAALIMPACNTEAMNLHLAEIAATVAPATPFSPSLADPCGRAVAPEPEPAREASGPGGEAQRRARCRASARLLVRATRWQRRQIDRLGAALLVALGADVGERGNNLGKRVLKLARVLDKASGQVEEGAFQICDRVLQGADLGRMACALFGNDFGDDIEDELPLVSDARVGVCRWHGCWCAIVVALVDQPIVLALAGNFGPMLAAFALFEQVHS